MKIIRSVSDVRALEAEGLDSLCPDHVAKLCKAADVSVVVMMGRNREQEYWSKLAPALRDAGLEAPIYDCDADSPSPGSMGSFETLLAAERGRSLDFDLTNDDNAIASLYHTGGTTGTPKLVRHTRLNEAHAARSCAVMHRL